MAPVIVDCRGHRCPVPTLRLRRAMETMDAGLVVLVADDPLARIDVPHLAAQKGWIVEEISQSGAELSFRVRKPASHPEDPAGT